MAKTCRAPKET